jgi:ABC-type transport system involved in cytochrome bd biosynthesis fused ATPase/permease subunit
VEGKVAGSLRLHDGPMTITRDHAFLPDLPTLVARGVAVHPRDRRLLDDFTVGLAAGELVAVVGDGEAAKSTLLASCGRPDQGRVQRSTSWPRAAGRPAAERTR